MQRIEVREAIPAEDDSGCSQLFRVAQVNRKFPWLGSPSLFLMELSEGNCCSTVPTTHARAWEVWLATPTCLPEGCGPEDAVKYTLPDRSHRGVEIAQQTRAHPTGSELFWSPTRL